MSHQVFRLTDNGSSLGPGMQLSVSGTLRLAKQWLVSDFLRMLRSMIGGFVVSPYHQKEITLLLGHVRGQYTCGVQLTAYIVVHFFPRLSNFTLYVRYFCLLFNTYFKTMSLRISTVVVYYCTWMVLWSQNYLYVSQSLRI